MSNNLLRKYGLVIAVLSGFLVLSGILVGFNLPNALLPNINRPHINLHTQWPGKTAAQIEQTLIAPLEKELASLSGLKEQETTIENGEAWTNLKFHPSVDMDQIYYELLSRVNQVPGWPAQVSAPKISNYSNGADATLASFFLYSKSSKSQQQFIHAFTTRVEPAFNEIEAINAIILGQNTTEQRVDIEFDPRRLALYSLTLEQVENSLQDMVDSSGNSMMLGSREFDLHFKGQIPLRDLEDLAVSAIDGQIVRLGDLATIQIRVASKWGYSALSGYEGMYFYLRPGRGINVLETIDHIKAVMIELNNGPLAALDMEIGMSRDDSKAIKRALKLVYGSLLLGMLLSMIVVYYFFRNLRVVFLIFVTIPVCLSLVTLLMGGTGRSVNVISLAGVALSVGLVLDAAIIVVDNIIRLLHNGETLSTSISRGIGEVRGALLSSTLSSIAIFLPILLMNSTEGQLFKDLALTISVALFASFLVAVLLLPVLVRYLRIDKTLPAKNLDRKKLVEFLSAPASNTRYSAVLLIGGLPLAVLITYFSMPELDVLPNPKVNSVRSFINFEEPLAIEKVKSEVVQVVEENINSELQQGTAPNFSIHGMSCATSYCILYFYPSKQWDYEQFRRWVDEKVLHGLIGTNIYTSQGGLLRIAIPNSRITQLDLRGADLDTLQRTGRSLMSYLREQFPKAKIDEGIPLHNNSTQIEFSPKHTKIAYLGITRADLNHQLVALTDGIFLGHFYTGSDTLPFYLKGRTPAHLNDLLQTEITVSGHGLIPLRDIVDVQMVLAPESILRVDRKVSVSLNLTPPENQPVGSFVTQVQAKVDDFIASSQISPGIYTRYRGSADQLKIFLRDFVQIFSFSLLILAVMIWLAIKSWRLTAAVLLSLPLAFAGGMLGLRGVGLFVPQNLDVITMIGFVILMGLVVNNAILLASQFQAGVQNGLTARVAIAESVRLRRRPIYMNTGSSILGMLPLVLNPGDGAEIYRGLAAVIIGGMMFSGLLSLSFMSALLGLSIFSFSERN